MSNVESNSPANEPTETNSSASEITRTEKILIAILVLVMVILLWALAQKILPFGLNFSSGNNRLLVGARSYSRLFGTHSMEYIFRLGWSSRTYTSLFDELSDSAESSPDGQWILFNRRETGRDGQFGSQIYVMRADGTQKNEDPSSSWRRSSHVVA